MKQKYYTPGIVPAFTIMVLLQASCLPLVSDPYIIPESIQKENVYYMPSAHNAPLLHKKNDLSTSIMTSFNGKQTGFEVQSAYVATNHVGLTLNYSLDLDGKSFIDFNRFEVGAGYVLPFSDKWLFETYGGWGTGKIENRHRTGFSNIKTNHYFLQPAISVTNKNKTVQFAFVSKFTRMHFRDIDTSFDTDREPFSKSQINSLYENPYQIFWEPGLIFRFGWKHFLFHTSFAVSTDLSNANLHQAKTNFSLGMTFRFSTRSKNSNPVSFSSLPRIE